jgi:hypothetical protein
VHARHGTLATIVFVAQTRKARTVTAVLADLLAGYLVITTEPANLSPASGMDAFQRETREELDEVIERGQATRGGADSSDTPSSQGARPVSCSAVRLLGRPDGSSAHLVVACREIDPTDGFVLTAYFSRRLSSRRVTLWQR